MVQLSMMGPLIAEGPELRLSRLGPQIDFFIKKEKGKGEVFQLSTLPGNYLCIAVHKDKSSCTSAFCLKQCLTPVY